MDKYEYLTGEDLGYKPEVVNKVTFEYSLLGEALNKANSKTNQIDKTDKKKKLIYNPQHSFAKFIGISDFKEMSLDSMDKKLLEFPKNFDGLKRLSPQTKKNEDLKAKVSDNNGDLFNELYYVYKEIYEEKKR